MIQIQRNIEVQRHYTETEILYRGRDIIDREIQRHYTETEI